MLQRLLDYLPGRAARRQFADIPHWQRHVHDQALRYTMTSSERIYSLINAVEYIVSQDIPGCIAECGVWRGGSMMVAARTLMYLKAADRRLVLFDTFEGMTQPDEQDVDHLGSSATARYRILSARKRGQRWSEADLSDVRANVLSTGYPEHLVTFVKGPVEKTLPKHNPDGIALLRLDTDWYASTKHELEHLYPLVSTGGVVQIDDYGHWQGARRAVDEYLQLHKVRCLLHRIDYTGREFVKPEGIYTRSLHGAA